MHVKIFVKDITLTLNLCLGQTWQPILSKLFPHIDDSISYLQHATLIAEKKNEEHGELFSNTTAEKSIVPRNVTLKIPEKKSGIGSTKHIFCTFLVYPNPKINC